MSSRRSEQFVVRCSPGGGFLCDREAGQAGLAPGSKLFGGGVPPDEAEAFLYVAAEMAVTDLLQAQIMISGGFAGSGRPAVIAKTIGFARRNLPALRFVLALVIVGIRSRPQPAADWFLPWVLLLPIGVRGFGRE